MKPKDRSASIVHWRFYFALFVLLVLGFVHWFGILASLQVLPNAQRGYEFL